MFNKRRQVYLTTGTPDRRTANDKLALLEAEIWEKFDQANLANHPLGAAYTELVDVVLKGKTSWNIEDLFDRNKRFLLEDDVRQRTAEEMGNARSAFDDFESGGAAQANYLKAEELLNIFVEEFRKVSEENFAPKKRGRLFSNVAKEYHNTTLFKTNKKSNQPKRQKTLAKEISQVATFIRWAGEVDLDSFTIGIASRYSEALANPDNGLISARGKIAGKETIESYISSVRNVLEYARRHDYIPLNPWVAMGLTGYGAAPESYRDWTEDEMRQVFSLEMPEQDRLCLAILACTGARLDEIALLQWDQFESGQTKDGDTIYWLDTTEAIVKNDPSRRLIPLLPRVAKMIEAHPRGLNKKEPVRLFSYGRDKSDGKAENKASLALMKHLRKINKSDKTFAVHGLRHTFTTMCRTEKVDWEMREFIMGRGGRGEGANYGKPAHVKTSLESIENIDTSFLDGMLVISKQGNKPFQMIEGWAGQKVDTGGGD